MKRTDTEEIIKELVTLSTNFTKIFFQIPFEKNSRNKKPNLAEQTLQYQENGIHSGKPIKSQEE